MSHHTNIVRIKAVANALSGLGQELVFVGGAVVSLYADRTTEEVRPTEDVDVLVEIYTRLDYSKLEEKLRGLGFIHDISASFVGRFLHEGLMVDILPLDEKVLGFSNRWYQEGFQNAIACPIDAQHTVRIFPAPYFLAAKLEAFKGRGKNSTGEYDGRMSTDFEDMVYVWANRSSVWDELAAAPVVLREYLRQEFTVLLNHSYFEEWIDAHAGYGASAAQIIIRSMKLFLVL